MPKIPKKRKSVISSHAGRNREEQNRHTKTVFDSVTEPTVPNATDKESTLADCEKVKLIEGLEYNQSTRKNKANRLAIHIKESWLNYVIGAAIALFLFLFVNVNVRMAEMNKDIAHQSEKIIETTSIVQQISNDFSVFKAELKSLNDRFVLFIQLAQKDNQAKEGTR